jgi:magnesium-transporting ATPase (P-type)
VSCCHHTHASGGTRTELDVPAVKLVPGDVVLLEEGDRLSADARLTDGSVEVDMAPLTGESQPVVRSATAIRRAASVLESEDLVFAGTLYTGGEAEAVVYATGMSTQLGRIAALSQRVEPEISPLQRQVNRVAWLIAAIAVAAGGLFFFAGTTLAGLSRAAAVTFAIGLLVANVPEGLLPTITLSLAGGVRRMAARRALVKRLTAVETLGSTDVICTDKTGTLTEGSMSVRHLWCAGAELEVASAIEGPVPDLFGAVLRTAVCCNNARLRVSPSERDPASGLVVAGHDPEVRMRRPLVAGHAADRLLERVGGDQALREPAGEDRGGRVAVWAGERCEGQPPRARTERGNAGV